MTLHLPHEIMWNANLMQLGNFITIHLARHVLGTFAHHQERYMLSCSIWFYAPSFWMGGGLESRCVGRVYDADGAVRGTIRSGSQDHHPSQNSTQKTICCNSKYNAPDDGRMYQKYAELRIHQSNYLFASSWHFILFHFLDNRSTFPKVSISIIVKQYVKKHNYILQILLFPRRLRLNSVCVASI